MTILDQRARCAEQSRQGRCATCITAEGRAEGVTQPCDCCCPVCVAAQAGSCQAGQLGQLGQRDCGQQPGYHVIRGRRGNLPHREWRLCEVHALPYCGAAAWRVIPLVSPASSRAVSGSA